MGMSYESGASHKLARRKNATPQAIASFAQNVGYPILKDGESSFAFIPAPHGQFLDQGSPPYIRTTGSTPAGTDHHLGQLPQGKCTIFQPFLEMLTVYDQSCLTTALMGPLPMGPEHKTFYLSMPQTPGVRAGQHLRIRGLQACRQRLQIFA